MIDAVIPDEAWKLWLREGVENMPTPKLHLFKNDAEIDAETVLSDLTEADFSGYASQAITWSTTYTDPASGPGASDISTLTFSHNGGGTANTVYGWYMTMNDGTERLLAAVKYPSSKSFSSAVDIQEIDISAFLGAKASS